MIARRPLWILCLLPNFLLACGASSDEPANNSLASLSDFCEKCSTCFASAGFSEGFCTPFIATGMFDRLSCNKSADISQLKNQNLTVSQLHAMSCQAFDDAE